MRSKIYAILVDGSNLYAANKVLGFSMDYNKLLHYFEGSVQRAVYFTAMPPKDEQSTLRPMVDYLEYNGWSVEQKETKEFVNASGETKVKGNMDVEIAVIAMELIPYVTDIVLVSGDGDFNFLVKALQSRGIRVTVVSTIKTRPSMIADSLRRQADEFIDLVDMQGQVKRTTPSPVDLGEDPVRAGRFKFISR